MDIELKEKSRRTVPAGGTLKKNGMRALIVALAVAAMSTTWSIATPTAAATEPQQFGDWILRCEAKGEGQEACETHFHDAKGPGEKIEDRTDEWCNGSQNEGPRNCKVAEQRAADDVDLAQ